jgi:hypothetical protein
MDGRGLCTVELTRIEWIVWSDKKNRMSNSGICPAEHGIEEVYVLGATVFDLGVQQHFCPKAVSSMNAREQSGNGMRSVASMLDIDQKQRSRDHFSWPSAKNALDGDESEDNVACQSLKVASKTREGSHPVHCSQRYPYLGVESNGLLGERWSQTP